MSLLSQISETLQKWKAQLRDANKKVGDALADPRDYENLFPEFQQVPGLDFTSRPESYLAV